jgi:hypothetical protein
MEDNIVHCKSDLGGYVYGEGSHALLKRNRIYDSGLEGVSICDTARVHCTMLSEGWVLTLLLVAPFVLTIYQMVYPEAFAQYPFMKLC